MSEPRKKADWPIIATTLLVVVLILAGLYAGGYYGMTRRVSVDPFAFEDRPTIRWYDAAWKARFYYPAAKIESRFKGHRVLTGGPPIPWPDE